MSQRLPVDRCLSDDLLARVFSMLESDVVQELKNSLLKCGNTENRECLAYHQLRVVRKRFNRVFKEHLRLSTCLFLR